MPDRLHDDEAAPFAALRRPAVEALARILYLRHATTTGAPAGDAACRGWLRRQKRAVANLRDAPALRRPRALSLLGDLFCSCFQHGGGGQETRGARELIRAEVDAALCPSHRALRPRVLAALAVLVEDEVRRHLDRAAGARRTREKKEVEEGAVEMWTESAARVAALWTGRRRWEEKMRRPLDVALPACVRGSGCAACRLAVVGGSPQFLMDLRTGLVARHEMAVATRRERRAGTPEPPVLLRMVEAWIDTCYARRSRRRIRRESDLMAALVLRQRLGGGRQRRAEAGGGGGRGQRRGGCWLARDEEARLMMEVDVEALLLSSGEDEDEEDEYEVEYAQGRWRLLKRATSRKEEEGYSQHLPAGAFAAVMRVTPERSSRSSSTRRRRSKERQSGEAKASPPSPPPPAKSDDDRQPSRTNERVPERSPPTSSLRASASTVVVEPPPRTTAAPDGIPAAAARTWPTQPSLPSPPLSLASEAELAAIYDAYYRAAAAADDVGTTAPSIRAGIRGPPLSPCTRSAPPQPVSPLSEHGYVAAEREVERRDHGDDESLHPRPLRTRHYRPRSSGIPVPKHPTAVGMPRVGSVHSVSSTVLLGCGGGGGRRWPRPVEGC